VISKISFSHLQISQAFGESLVEEYFTSAFIDLLEDNEGEVRTAAASQLPGYANLVDKSVVLEKLLPRVRDLAVDENQYTRAALAKDISGLAPIVGEEA
jgi:serine/threonine-protein phosphatase 2A regulatory subunit A